MRRWIVFLFLAFSLFTPLPVLAQTAKPEIERMMVEIWPEYDRPDVLVIYRITLTDSTSLPASLSIRIPREAGQPFNVAMVDVDNLPYTLDYKSTVENEWLRVSFTAPTANIQLEYYDPRLKRTGNRRDFEYKWAGDYKVKFMSVRVQQPVNSTNLTLVPALGTGRQESDMLVYYTAMLGSVSVNTPLTIKLNYDKPDDKLSYTPLTVTPVEPINSQTPGRMSLEQALPVAVVVLGSLLVLGGAFWYLRIVRGKPSQDRRRHAAAAAANRSNKSTSSPSDAVVYCSQCGKRSSPGDNFCRICGTRLEFE
jgi:hypothetical protein